MKRISIKNLKLNDIVKIHNQGEIFIGIILKIHSQPNKNRIKVKRPVMSIFTTPGLSYLFQIFQGDFTGFLSQESFHRLVCIH